MIPLPDPAKSFFDRGACRGMDVTIFFPEAGASSALALAVCKTCEVRKECGDYAIDHEEPYGVWGGLPPKARTWQRNHSVSSERMYKRTNHGPKLSDKCKQGHLLSDDNLYLAPGSGRRRCKICIHLYSVEYRKRMKG